VALISGPGSHLVAGLAASDVLIDIPAETTEISGGDPVEVLEL
jgi:molybdopterin molybdotransferase